MKGCGDLHFLFKQQGNNIENQNPQHRPQREGLWLWLEAPLVLTSP